MLRNTHGSAIFTGKLGKPEHKTNYAARFAFRYCTIGSDLLQWMQNDPSLPRSAEQMKQAFNFARASNKAKQLSDGNKVQLMANTGGACRPKRCNGLDATAPAPAALAAFARAFKEVNKDALLQLHRKLIERLVTLVDCDLGENGRKLRDSTADDFVEKVFHFVMLQPMDRPTARTKSIATVVLPSSTWGSRSMARDGSASGRRTSMRLTRFAFHRGPCTSAALRAFHIRWCTVMAKLARSWWTFVA